MKKDDMGRSSFSDVCDVRRPRDAQGHTRGQDMMHDELRQGHAANTSHASGGGGNARQTTERKPIH